MKIGSVVKKCILVAACVAIVAGIVAASVYGLSVKSAADYLSIPVVKLRASDRKTVDRRSSYLGHPDLVMSDTGQLICMYPAGHGKGAIIAKTSDDFGETWSDRLTDTPESWQKSQETPTLYRLQRSDGSDKLLLVSGCPSWGNVDGWYTDGFNCSVADGDGSHWSEFYNFYGREWAQSQPNKPADYDNLSEEEKAVLPNYDAQGKVLAYDAIVAMSSLTRLKENGVYVDKWLGTFHDYDFYNYASILTFDAEGKPQWSAPRRYLSQWRANEIQSNICEVEIIRTPAPRDDTLILIGRANSRKTNSVISFSYDEGATWTQPKELPRELCGDRHKAEYDATTGKLAISFRQIIPGIKQNAYAADELLCGDWVAWIGTFDDLLTYADDDPSNDAKGDALLVLGSNNVLGSPGDNGYSGTVCQNGTFVMVAYGRFDPWAGNPYIMQVKFRLSDYLDLN